MYSAQVQNAVNCSQTEIVRPVINFSPSLWGNQFINYNFNTQVAEKYSEEIDVLKNEARNMLMDSESKMVETMNLIDTLERLGLSYHFENEIEEKLQQFYNLNTNYVGEAYDLYTVALYFRLFRQHGFRILCDVFEKFKNENGEFQEGLKTDARGLLSLYDAAQLRIHEEHILDDAFAFAIANLKSLAPNLCSPLREQVVHDLEQQLHMGVPRVEARKFISIYEEDESKNEVLMKFAKLDYNLLQMLHKKELDEVSRWWKELDFASKLPYARDRVVECFFWALGVHHEPQYSRARVMLAKTIAMTSVLDDTYDAYGTIEELDVLTKAIDRWNITEIDRLPYYIRPFYEALLKLYEQFEEELAEDGRSYATYYPIEALKELARSYHVEAKWFIQGYLPPFEEYLDNGLVTSTYYYLTTTSLLGTKSTTKEEFEWLSKNPKMLVASLINCRVIDDIASYEVEKERGQIATGIDCYMNENGVTKEVAMNKFYEIATNAWKDVNEECLRPFPCSRDVLMRILNLDRMIDLVYKNNEDGYTRPEKLLKPHIVSVLVDPVKI